MSLERSVQNILPVADGKIRSSDQKMYQIGGKQDMHGNHGCSFTADTGHAEHQQSRKISQEETCGSQYHIVPYRSGSSRTYEYAVPCESRTAGQRHKNHPRHVLQRHVHHLIIRRHHLHHRAAAESIYEHEGHTYRHAPHENRLHRLRQHLPVPGPDISAGQSLTCVCKPVRKI